jgi:hypothetical protein
VAKRERHPSEDDGFATAATLFGFYALCLAGSAYLYWYGAGKLPWQ